jgi:endonuclease/exonuclease/phosphatase family metal-dependent hydrolase
VQAWEEKLGEKPKGEPESRRLDYLLYRGVEIAASGAVALRDATGSASDHRLVWADIAGGSGR